MNAAEINRMIEIGEKDKHVSDTIAEGLEEEPDKDDECADPGEAEYFMKLMLKAVIEAADTSDSIESFRGSMAGILA